MNFLWAVVGLIKKGIKTNLAKIQSTILAVLSFLELSWVMPRKFSSHDVRGSKVVAEPLNFAELGTIEGRSIHINR